MRKNKGLYFNDSNQFQQFGAYRAMFSINVVMCLMEHELALFMEDLQSALDNSKRPEDRRLYETYLAHAACIISKVVLKAPVEELFDSIDTNEKLWGNTWLIDSAPNKHPDSYKKFKELAEYPGYGNT